MDNLCMRRSQKNPPFEFFYVLAHFPYLSQWRARTPSHFPKIPPVQIFSTHLFLRCSTTSTLLPILALHLITTRISLPSLPSLSPSPSQNAQSASTKRLHLHQLCQKQRHSNRKFQTL